MNEALARWKSAVIHLECATDSMSMDERAQMWFKLAGEVDERRRKEVDDLMASRSRDVRYQGSAIFMTDGAFHFLVTARHVLFDELGASQLVADTMSRAKRLFAKHGDKLRMTEPELIAREIELVLRYGSNSIFPIIFRVPGLDEVHRLGVNGERCFLVGLGAGVTRLRPYAFSNPEHDLAAVVLAGMNQEFAQELERVGYVPIHLDQLSDGPSAEGAEVFTVGYPQTTSLVGQLPATTDTMWSTKYVSAPTFSFGRVGMLNTHLHFFWADMTISPGNSGGPVVEDGRLVGVVSAQPTLRSEDQTTTVRAPFCQAINARHVRPLIEELQRRAQAGFRHEPVSFQDVLAPPSPPSS